MKRFGLTESETTLFVGFLAAAAEITALNETPTPESIPISDPKDVHVLQTALSGKVDYLCTRDLHFSEVDVLALCAGHGISVTLYPGARVRRCM